MAERELVRCGCGLVRNDDDPKLRIFPTTLLVRAESEWLWGNQYEDPRICRGCGCLYMLPKPSAPKGEFSNA